MEQQKTKENKKRYFAYDLMRAAAMLLIVFYHMNCEWSARLMDIPSPTLAIWSKTVCV